MKNTERFLEVLYAVPPRIKQVLLKLSPVVQSNCEEIRIRTGLPVCLTVNGETVFVRENGQTQFYITNDLLKAEKEDLQNCFKLLCNNSAFAHIGEIENGFIAMKNGCRAGICGTRNLGGNVREISSVNIRIAKEIFGAANDILKGYTGGGLLIAGAPGSGKTTVLRDLCRQLSNGVTGRVYRIAVVDSRNEISGSFEGQSKNDLGANTDILLNYEKAEGIEIALRTLFPHYILFDEIATTEELKKVEECFCAGVNIITTAHIGSEEELLNRKVTAALIKSSAIKKIALLPKIHGGKIKLIDTKELICCATA